MTTPDAVSTYTRRAVLAMLLAQHLLGARGLSKPASVDAELRRRRSTLSNFLAT
jgi:hypothetical protein